MAINHADRNILGHVSAAPREDPTEGQYTYPSRFPGSRSPTHICVISSSYWELLSPTTRMSSLPLQPDGCCFIRDGNQLIAINDRARQLTTCAAEPQRESNPRLSGLPRDIRVAPKLSRLPGLSLQLPTINSQSLDLKSTSGRENLMGQAWFGSMHRGWHCGARLGGSQGGLW